MTRSTWTPFADERLRELWAEGATSAAIGRAMHTTKCAIIGRAHRLKLAPRPSPLGIKGEVQPYPQAKKPKAQVVVCMRHLHKQRARPDATPAGPRPPMPERESRSCRWPLWANDARPNHSYCGERITRGPYCCSHGSLAYDKTTWRAAT